MENIGKNIKLRRRQLGIYQDELAQKVGCSQAHISKIEHGQDLSITLLIKISEVLNCQIADIFK